MTPEWSTEELREKAEAATPGPWHTKAVTVRERLNNEVTHWMVRTQDESNVANADEPDAAFIATADPQTVLGLLDRIETLEAALGEVLEMALLNGGVPALMAHEKELLGRTRALLLELEERGSS